MSHHNTDHSGTTSVGSEFLMLSPGQKANVVGVSLQMVVSCLCPRLAKPKASMPLYIEDILTRCTTLNIQMS